MECQLNATDKTYVIERHQEYVHWFLEEANLHHTSRAERTVRYVVKKEEIQPYAWPFHQL